MDQAAFHIVWFFDMNLTCGRTLERFQACGTLLGSPVGRWLFRSLSTTNLELLCQVQLKWVLKKFGTLNWINCAQFAADEFASCFLSTVQVEWESCISICIPSTLVGLSRPSRLLPHGIFWHEFDLWPHIWTFPSRCCTCRESRASGKSRASSRHQGPWTSENKPRTCSWPSCHGWSFGGGVTDSSSKSLWDICHTWRGRCRCGRFCSVFQVLCYWSIFFHTVGIWMIWLRPSHVFVCAPKTWPSF